MKFPSIHRVEAIIHCAPLTTKEFRGNWTYARPSGCPSLWQRLRAAWLVFTGRADALVWGEGQ